MLRSAAIVAVAGVMLWGAHEAVSDPVKTKRMPKHWQTWVAIGRCEQPGPGKWGIYWSHPGPTYGGGLGIYQGTWNAFKPPVRGFPSTPGQASWRQQMWVANRIYARYGTSAWGCG